MSKIKARRGRPPRKDGKRGINLTVRIAKSDRAKLGRIAKSLDLSLGDVITAMIEAQDDH